MESSRVIPLQDGLFAGTVSLEYRDGWVKPWRIPYGQYDLFPPDGLSGKGEIPAGVCLRFRSNTTRIIVGFLPSQTASKLDCVVDGHLVSTADISPGESEARFEGLAAEEKEIEFFLTQTQPVQLISLQVEAGATLSTTPGERRRWITYGSSITQCAAAASPAQTWPAIVARRRHLDLTCLGYGGNCHLEPMVARMIRDLPADIISLCLGINVMGGASLSPRTFRAAVIGFISIVREKHADIPLAVISPIISPPRESNPNAVGLTLQAVRKEIRAAVEALQAHGDRQLFYVDGLDVFGEDFLQYLPDQLHPNAEGYRILAGNFDRLVMPRLLS